MTTELDSCEIRRDDGTRCSKYVTGTSYLYCCWCDCITCTDCESNGHHAGEACKRCDPSHKALRSPSNALVESQPYAGKVK
jgi:hypothetical protein